MQTHKKISIINTFLLFVFFSIFIYFFNIKISSSNILKIFLLIFTYYLLSNFFTKFFLLNTYKTIQKLDKILSVIHGKFINELEDNFISLQECFN